MGKFVCRFLASAIGLCSLIGQAANAKEVTLAGMAFSGDHHSIAQRFPYTLRYEQALKSSGTTAHSRVRDAVGKKLPQNFTLTANPIEQLKGRDQALVASLVITSEIVSVEDVGGAHKLFVLVRGQALFFDFKAMAVVRAYPLSFAYIDNFVRGPSESEILEGVRVVYEGTADKPGIFERFASKLGTASIPDSTPRYLQVSSATLRPEFVAALPAYLKSSPDVYETWAADLVSEALSTRAEVPIVPYSKGYAIGNVMSMRVLDGEVFSLTLPKPDYEINADFTGVKRVTFSQTGGGSSFVYGTYATMRIVEPLSNTVYMDTALKNAEVKVVPSSQTQIDDFPAYYDSINGMFVKLAEAVNGKGNSWVKAAAAAPDIEAQIRKTQELMKLCR